MNITLQTNNFNSQYKYNNNNKSLNRGNVSLCTQPSFKGIEDIPAKSNLLNPFKRTFNKFTSWLSENYTTKLYTSKLAKFLANHTEKLDSVVDHMQVMGSIIISGMYMTQTLRNQQLDEDRRRTLAVNQGLTFILSTAGSYLIDRRLDNWWEKVTTKYAQKQTSDDKLGEKIQQLNNKIIAETEKKQNKLWKDIPKKERPKLITTLKYVEDNLQNTSLETKIKGMGVLKKLIVFGTVYRFIAPVAVTPFATMIGNKLASNKNKDNGMGKIVHTKESIQKEQEKEKTANNIK